MPESWLLVDCAHRGEVRIAAVNVSRRPVIGRVHHFDATRPTFTDVLLEFERVHGASIAGMQAALAIGGIASGGSAVIERTRWIVSRDGLTSLFGRPPLIVNEVAAQAWALFAAPPQLTPVHGSGRFDPKRRARYVFCTYEEGVGTAIIDVDQTSRVTVLDAEGGNVDFSASTPTEATVLRAFGDRTPSWEEVLMLTPTDARLAGVPERERADLFNALLGRFASNMVYAAGAWDGVFLTGRRAPRGHSEAMAFDRGYTTNRPYRRQLSSSTCWCVVQEEAVLRGCAAMLAEHYAPSDA